MLYSTIGGFSMAQSYAEFKDYLVSFLWKVGDQQLINALDNLVKMGEAKLTRDLDAERRNTSVQLIVTNQREQLPVDYYKIRSVVDAQGNLGELLYVTPAHLEAERQRQVTTSWLPLYSIEGSNLLFVGPTQGGFKTTGPTPPANPQDGDLWARTTVAPGLYVWVVDPTSSQWVQLTAENATEAVNTIGRAIVINYQRRVPDFKTTDTSWLADEELDLLTYATLYHSAPFLREDERVALWQQMYIEALNKTNENSAHSQTRGIAAPARLPRQAGVRRRR